MPKHQAPQRSARRRAMWTGLALGAFVLAVIMWTIFAIGGQVFAGRDL